MTMSLDGVIPPDGMEIAEGVVSGGALEMLLRGEFVEAGAWLGTLIAGRNPQTRL